MLSTATTGKEVIDINCESRGNSVSFAIKKKYWPLNLEKYASPTMKTNLDTLSPQILGPSVDIYFEVKNFSVPVLQIPLINTNDYRLKFTPTYTWGPTAGKTLGIPRSFREGKPFVDTNSIENSGSIENYMRVYGNANLMDPDSVTANDKINKYSFWPNVLGNEAAEDGIWSEEGTIEVFPFRKMIKGTSLHIGNHFDPEPRSVKAVVFGGNLLEMQFGESTKAGSWYSYERDIRLKPWKFVDGFEEFIPDADPSVEGYQGTVFTHRSPETYNTPTINIYEVITQMLTMSIGPHPSSQVIGQNTVALTAGGAQYNPFDYTGYMGAQTSGIFRVAVNETAGSYQPEYVESFIDKNPDPFRDYNTNDLVFGSLTNPEIRYHLNSQRYFKLFF